MSIVKPVIGALVIVLIAFFSLIGVFADYYWFQSLGFDQVFMRIIVNSVMVGGLFGVIFLAFSSANLFVSRKLSSKRNKKSSLPFMAVILVLSLLVGIVFSDWETVLKYENSTDFGVTDPIFNHDISFYVFELPFYHLLIGFVAVSILLTLIVTSISYLYSTLSSSKKMPFFFEEGSGPQFVGFDFKKNQLSTKSIIHLSFLAGIFLITIAAGIFLNHYSILFSRSGVVFGAGYTDVVVSNSFIILMAILVGLVGLFVIANGKLMRWKLLMKIIPLLFVIAMLGGIATAVVQALIVSPNEFNLESQYIENNIQATLNAYNIGNIKESLFTLEYNLTKNDIIENSDTTSNIRIWDWRPLSQTFQQLQLFRTYYEFSDVDIDRYFVDGEYKQVMMSVREMNTDSIQSKAQTWVNKALVYTHGYGTVMIPVDRAKDGLPEFIIKDIPPISESGFEVVQPAIYFGESSSRYVIVNTNTREFDYPSGDQNIFTTYSGNDGVTMDGFKKLVYALDLKDPEILLSNSINSESRILLYRKIMERAYKIAPFLEYDGDPYIVLSDGRLFWIIDAYTTTDKYPYSEMTYTDIGPVNYIRNSVKVVIDAYNGDISFYVIDDEPVLTTYRKIFPEIFKDFSEMPEDLKSHIRYPEDLFSIQASIYSTYHMKNPQVFYNREDVWVTPDEIYSDGRRPMLPYYIIMKLPGEPKEEFVMIMPFTPKGKENMIAWMAAKSDMPNYGELLVYQFSKQTLAYGPMQIEARIDQDTEISQLLTLWGQSGSTVIRGNTLVIPIESSVLYIEPLYLEATERGTLPELKRVIVVYDNKLTMKETLQEALNEIFGSSGTTTNSEPGKKTSDELLADIEEYYTKAQDALKEGELGKYAEYMDAIGQLLGL